jgi:hypothetical protein
METPTRSWSRRALLTGAAGSAAALAATALAPAAALAGSDGDVVLGANNASSSATRITNSTSGDTAFAASAVEGFGVVGDGDIGVVGSGRLGVLGDSAALHGAGVYGYGEAAGCGVLGVVGGAPPEPAGNVGVQAVATESTGTALRVDGKVKFSRSGRLTVSSGKSSVVKTLAGVTTSSIIIAVLQQVETGTWIRAAVPGTGKFTVYFNKALPSSSVVGWFVIN